MIVVWEIGIFRVMRTLKLCTWISQRRSAIIGVRHVRQQMEKLLSVLAQRFWLIPRRSFVATMAIWQRCTRVVRWRVLAYLSAVVRLSGMLVILVAGPWRSVIIHRQLSGC